MISGFLQYGYLGLLALLIWLCYKIIEQSPNANRSFSQTIWMLVAFSIASIICGLAGFLWASKELEISKSKEGVAALLKQEIDEERKSHEAAMKPLLLALNGVTDKLNFSSFDTERRQHMDELQQINAVIQGREAQFTKRLEVIKEDFKTLN
jgi:hypothetical protein